MPRSRMRLHDPRSSDRAMPPRSHESAAARAGRVVAIASHITKEKR
jgi:hypothetical protein